MLHFTFQYYLLTALQFIYNIHDNYILCRAVITACRNVLALILYLVYADVFFVSFGTFSPVQDVDAIDRARADLC